MTYTIVPLGNPGSKYARTRHNVGRVAIDMIKDEIEKIENCEIFIPETFMNESGKTISEYFRYHEGRELVIIYDDKDLAFGKLRISHDRGDGGHNGVKSVIESLGTKEFIRIRIGIAHKDTDGKEIKSLHGEEVQGYVMGQISEDEMESLKGISMQLVGAIKTITEEGYQKAMERYN
ncbi:aminoacyl-tRNA hydrolase [Candidatus Gracilibacteria bacterium]|nr:aminoacyl-tRNA hydrolase [Candidatus Gracilibacteria bacterium]MCF7898376.1 aminoacyl-tRNA hydrolase [Candidatus Paceibacterota bacterium]